MNNIILTSFSARSTGNCHEIIAFLQNYYNGCNIETITAKDLNISPCKNCTYECLKGACHYLDDIEWFWNKMLDADLVFWLIPMYSGYPSSLYFQINERSQEFFMKKEDKYEGWFPEETLYYRSG